MQRTFFLFLCFSTQMLSAQTPVITKSKPFILGKVIEIYSKVLSEKRILNIYLPEDYKEKDSATYPVIYVLDGSADEDFIHIVGLVQFLSFPWIKSVPKSIVVGIANVDRRRDFTFPTNIEKDKKDFPTTGKSANFIQFVEQELQPFIEKHFKVTASRTLIGQSLGGLVATEILFKKPYLFSKYLIVSPSLWWDNESLLAIPPVRLATAGKDPLSIFLASGMEGEKMNAAMHTLLQIIKEDKNKKVSADLQIFTNENHASILHNAAYKGLEFINRISK